MPIPARIIRRCLLPVSAALICLASVLLAATLLVGLLIAPLTRRRRVIRLSVFALAYCTMEIEVLSYAGYLWAVRLLGRIRRRGGLDEWWRVAHQRLLVHALGRVLGSARRCFAFRWTVQDHGAAEVLHGPDPALVLARHGGPGDSFTLAYLLASSYGRSIRIVLKELLQVDPALDVLLNRLGACFVRGGATTDERIAQLQSLARDLSPSEAILLFPEGANWTPRRRSRAITHLRSRLHHREARAAQLMEHVLPPRTTGVLACLDGRPGLAVVVAAHTGLEHVTSVAEAWRSVPVPGSAPMHIRLWQAGPVPGNGQDRLAWLEAEWAVVDEWIDTQKSVESTEPRRGRTDLTQTRLPSHR